MVRIECGDCMDVLPGLPFGSVHCVVTSPPYWGLRDYGVDGQLGLESTPEEYVERMVGVFREVWRVLRDDGTVWLNLGDSYNNYRPGNYSDNRAHAFGGERTKKRGMPDDPMKSKRGSKLQGIKEKDLVGIPWRVAFALQADGWYLRQDIIWHKPNPMPESVRDRCTKAHEYVFLLSKNAKYYYDSDAVREPISASTQERNKYAWKGHLGRHVPDEKRDERSVVSHGEFCNPLGRNRRSVWTIPTHAYPQAHFATFPPKLVEPCILAGCPEGGTVLDPFFGSGTVGAVCQKWGRKCIGIELSADYCELARRRFDQGVLF
jgi:DNA modification methylase